MGSLAADFFIPVGSARYKELLLFFYVSIQAWFMAYHMIDFGEVYRLLEIIYIHHLLDGLFCTIVKSNWSIIWFK